MAQTGRNEPCPCGSGKKYKKCCRVTEEAAANERLRAERAVVLDLRVGLGPEPDEDPFDDERLTEVTNSVLDLIRQRRFDDALAACDVLLRDFPEVHDGFERSARVHDALGNHALAADFWQKTVDFVEQPDQRPYFDEESIDDYRQRLAASRARADAAEAEPTPSGDHDRAP